MDLILSFRFSSLIVIALLLGACSRGDLATVPVPRVNPDVDCAIAPLQSSLISALRIYSKGKDGRAVTTYFDDQNIALTFQGGALAVEKGVGSLAVFADFSSADDMLVLEDNSSARLASLSVNLVGESEGTLLAIEDQKELALPLMVDETAAVIDLDVSYAFVEERAGCTLLGVEQTREVIGSGGDVVEEVFVERIIRESFSIRFALMRDVPSSEIVRGFFASSPSASTSLGASVSFDGEFFAFGVPGANSGAGTVGICSLEDVQSGGLVGCNYFVASNGQAGDAFGSKVLLRNNRLFVSAPGEDSEYAGVFNGLASSLSLAYTQADSGAVYEFVVSENGAAVEVAYIKNPENVLNVVNSDVKFGFAMTEYDGDIYIGAPEQRIVGGGSSSDPVGAVYQFFYSEDVDGNLTRGAYNKLLSDVSHDDQGFGSSIAVSEDYLVIGAPREGSRPSNLPVFDGVVDPAYIESNTIDDIYNSSGAALVMKRPPSQGAVLEKLAYLKPENLDELDQFGASISLFENTLFVGAPRDDSSSSQVDVGLYDNTLSNSGAVYRYAINESDDVVLVDFIKSRQPATNANFGRLLDAEQRYLVVANSSATVDFSGLSATPTHVEIINYETYEDSIFLSAFEDETSVFSAKVETVEFYGGMVLFGLPKANVGGVNEAGAFALWR